MSSSNQLHVFDKGERIISEGERGTQVYILRAGSIKVCRGSATLARLEESGIVLGELAALTGRPRSASIIANEPCKLVSIDFNPRKVMDRSPEIIQKIEEAVDFRYKVAANKTKFYIENTAIVRRQILQAAMVKMKKRYAGKIVDETAIRRKARRVLDESFEIYGDEEDPRVLRKIAEENSVSDFYNTQIEEHPWLSESMFIRFQELQDHMKLRIESDAVARLKEKALVTVDMLDLLGEFEMLPGVRKEMELVHLEQVVPYPVRLESFRNLVRKRYTSEHPEADERGRLYFERTLIQAIDRAKIDAGRDITSLSKLAGEHRVSSEYEEALRNMVEFSESNSTIVEMPAIQ